MADTRYTTKMMERKPYRVWGDWNLWNSAVATHYSHTVILDAMNYKKRKWEKRKFDAKKFKLKRMEAFPKEWNADIEFHRWQTAWIFIPSKAWKGGGKEKNANDPILLDKRKYHQMADVVLRPKFIKHSSDCWSKKRPSSKDVKTWIKWLIINEV